MKLNDIAVGLLLTSMQRRRFNMCLRTLDVQLRYLPLLDQLIETKSSPWRLRVINNDMKGDNKSHINDVQKDFVSYDFLANGGLLAIHKNESRGYYLNFISHNEVEVD